MDYQELNLKKGDLLTAAHMAHIEEGIDTVTAEVAKIKKAKIVLRNDTIINWEESTLILAKGEPAVGFDEEGAAKLKIGDGESTWSELPYVAANGEGGDIVIPEDI